MPRGPFDLVECSAGARWLMPPPVPTPLILYYDNYDVFPFSLLSIRLFKLLRFRLNCVGSCAAIPSVPYRSVAALEGCCGVFSFRLSSNFVALLHCFRRAEVDVLAAAPVFAAP